MVIAYITGLTLHGMLMRRHNSFVIGSGRLDANSDPFELFFRRSNGSPPDCINQMKVVLYEELNDHDRLEGCCVSKSTYSLL